MRISPPEAQQPSRRTLSLSSIYPTLILLGFVTLSLLISSVVVFKLQDAIYQTQQANVQTNFTTLKTLLQTYLDDRTTQLIDHARFPLMIQAVMQPKRNPEQVADFMAELRVLGEDSQLILVDFLGQPIHATHATIHTAFTDAPWLENLIQGRTTHHIGFNSQGQTYFWEIAVPILFKGNPEGILVGEIPIGPNHQFQGLHDSLVNAHLQLFDHNQLVTTWGHIESTDNHSIEQTDVWGLTLQYTASAENTSSAMATLLQPILLMSFIVTSLCVMIGITLGRKFLITPLEQLKIRSSALLEEETIQLLPENQTIEELRELAIHFNVVQQRAWERKLEVQRANHTLESRVEERTAALAQKEQQFRTIVEAVSNGILMVDQQGIIVLINEVISKQFGYTREELTGQVVEILLPTRFRAQHPELRANFLSSQKDYSMGLGRELFGQRKNGTEFPLEILLNSMTTEMGTFVLATIVDITERKNAQEALQQSEIKNRLIVENSLDAHIVMDSHGKITGWNPQAELIFGWSQEEIIGKSVASTIIPIHHRESHAHGMKTFFESGSGSILNQRMEITALNRNGVEFPIELAVTPVKLNETIQFSAFVRDLRERQKSEKQMQELNRNNELLLRSAGEGIYGIDLEGNTTFVNPAAAKMLGSTPEELIGLPMHTTIHHTKTDGSPYPREECPMYASFMDGSIHHIGDEVFWRKNNTSFPVTYTSTPIPDEDGRLTGVVVTFQDITEQKAHQDKILALSERLQIATQSAQIGIWDWDVIHNQLTWDTQMYALYGVQEETFTGAYEAWTQGIHPEDNAKAQAALQEALDGGKPFDTEFRVVWADHSVHHIRAFAMVQRNEHNQAIRMTGVNWDMTAEKVTEETLKQYIDDLRRSNEELEQFAYVASHDLQEPLRKIRNFSELLVTRAKGQLPQESEKYLSSIVNGAIRLQTLVQDLLAYSRVARGELQVKIVDLQQIAEQAKSNLEAVITDSQATVNIHSLPTVKANPSQMEQLFQNLIGNGLKYHGSHAPIIEVFATQTEHNWEIGIRDNGIGLDPQYADRIFVIFQRLHAKQEYAGTGIGLAICKKIVELHGGEIWVTSKLDEGSTFFFTLPQQRVQPRRPKLAIANTLEQKNRRD